MDNATKPKSAFAKRYKKLEKLGEGSYGVVYKAKDVIEDLFVAIKKIRFENKDDGIPYTSIREIALLKEVKHRYVVDLKNVILSETQLKLVFEFLDNDLSRYMKSFGPIPSIQSFTYQLLLGIEYCHAHLVMHRDLKPQNLLVNKIGILKIADFGLARTFGIQKKAYTHEVVTLWYRAPEILLGGEYCGTAIDMWSIGCIFAEMLMNTPLFPGSTEIDEIFKIFALCGIPSKEVWHTMTNRPYFKYSLPESEAKHAEEIFKDVDLLAFDLLFKFIVLDPSKRISAKLALQHAYFDDMDKSFYQSEL